MGRHRFRGSRRESTRHTSDHPHPPHPPEPPTPPYGAHPPHPPEPPTPPGREKRRWRGRWRGRRGRGPHHHHPTHDLIDHEHMFGVRRPLRFLARQLDLSEEQITQLAAIIDDLKTERAQAAVDDRRARKLYVQALGGDAFDAERARAAAEQRVKTTAHLQEAVTAALSDLHAILDARQREQLAYLIRTGALDF